MHIFRYFARAQKEKSVKFYKKIAFRRDFSPLNDNLNPKRGEINTISSDTTIIALDAGTYQVVLSSGTAVTNGYVPAQYGTLVVNDSGKNYKSYMFVTTGNAVYSRICHKGNSTWYTAWQQLALNINSGYGVGVRQMNFTIASNGGTKTISGFTQNQPYLVMISTDNPSAWKYAAVWFMGSQNRTAFTLGTAAGIEVTASGSTALVVKNTNSGYALIGNYIIVGYGTNNLTVS